jgi:hypothetical protein
VRKRLFSIGWCFGLLLLAVSFANAQRISIPNNAATETFQRGSITANPLTPVPQLGPATNVAPSATLGQPFDPYSTTPNAASQAPSLLSPPNAAPYTNSPTTPFWQTPSTPVYPQGTTPGYVSPNTTYPPGTFQQQPSVLFPNGLNLPNWNLPDAQPGPYLRLFQDIRMTYTWLHGNDSTREMTTHDTQVATTVNFPNFFFSGQPLHVSPNFIVHFWDGPDTDPVPPAPLPGAFPTELPSRVYSTFLTFRWQPLITPSFGADVEFNAGVYSDFDTVRKDSVRLSGTGLLVLALTPAVSLKGGVTYLDRVDVKLLPAGGILWRPNPQTRFDIYFPKPKLAQYLYTIGNTDVWWYINGEYGGGSWTIDRAEVIPGIIPGTSVLVPIGGDRRVDINDFRVGGGLEWTHQNGLFGFVEAAYVFERELVFASGAPGRHNLKDTFMLRGGLAY